MEGADSKNLNFSASGENLKSTGFEFSFCDAQEMMALYIFFPAAMNPYYLGILCLYIKFHQ